MGERIVEVSAGDCHVLARGGTGKVFSWGWNGRGQLGRGGREDKGLPGYVVLEEESRGCPYKCRSAQGGSGVSYILVDERKVMWSGKGGAEEGDSVGFKE